MSLEAVVFQKLQSSISHERREYTTSIREGDEDKNHNLAYELPNLRPGQDAHPGTTLINVVCSSSSSLDKNHEPIEELCNPVSNHVCGRRRRIMRKRRRNSEEEEEEERQRKNHIQVERNRRKQMNNYLSLLRSLMPPSYSLKGEQASIVEGAINFVKELEQLLQYLQSHHHHHKRIKLHHQPTIPSLFSDFFNFPQYSTMTTSATNHSEEAVADVEVAWAGQYITVKVFTRKQPKQLLRVLVELSCAQLTVLHLNVTSIDAFVLYTFSLKKEDECELNTVNEIAAAVHDIIRRIQHHAKFEL